MRKIEREMLKAIEDRRNWSSDNTEVKFMHEGTGNTGRVELHGHLIAYIDSKGEMRAYMPTFRKWPTRTTCSRLRALGFGAHLIKGQPHIDGVPA